MIAILFLLIPMIVVQINAREALFSLFRQEIAKRFDRTAQLKTEDVLWNDLRHKVKQYFTMGSKNNKANMGYFLHVVPKRRVFQFNPYEGEDVLGVPSNQWHLPAAEPILPGHTLLRPTLTMLKSAVKFPHVENEDGGRGVYGNQKKLGLRYDGKAGRVLYSNNRRMFYKNMDPQTYDDVKPRFQKPKYYIIPVSLDSVKDSDTKSLIEAVIENLKSRRRRQILYDNVKLNINKPDMSDFYVSNSNNVTRNWWYFNQDDLTQLDVED